MYSPPEASIQEKMFGSLAVLIVVSLASMEGKISDCL